MNRQYRRAVPFDNTIERRQKVTVRTTIQIAVATEYQTATRPFAHDVYEIDPNGRFLWLQRIAQRILAKYGKQPISVALSYRTQTIEVDRVMVALGQLIENASRITNEYEFVAIIGAREWADLRASKDADLLAPMIDLNLPVPERLAQRFGDYQLCNMHNLRVIVLSWHAGITLLPVKMLRRL